jgi:hypothetical protein
MSENAFVEVDLNYLLNTGQRPVNYAVSVPPPAGQPQRSGEVAPTRVRVQNARLAPESPTLDRNGFQLVPSTTELRDFSDDQAIRERYYPEVQALLKRVTGASKVVVFDHTQRLGRLGHNDAKLREPAQRVHNDQTFVSGPRRVRDHLPADEAEQRLKKRHAIVNVWRPVGEPVQTWPLAMCDARTIGLDDLIPSDLVYPDKVGETYAFQPNREHRWSYFPKLQPDEVLLLKIFDSNTDGTARLTAHTSFQDPNSAPDAPPRRSIEVRTLVFWD